MIYITDSFAIIESNSITSNGNYEYGLPVVSVEKGAAIVELNTFEHLYCRDTCIVQISEADAQI